MKTHTLLVWEWNPENTEIYLIPNEALSKEQHEIIAKAHGKLINSNATCSDNDGCAFLNMALCDPKEYEANKHEKFAEHMGVLRGFQRYNFERDGVSNNILDNVSAAPGLNGALITKVIVSGFVL